MSPAPVPPAWPPRALPLVAALLAAGCGLADYEARVGAEKAKLLRTEREARYLGDPITPPAVRKDGDRKDAPAESLWNAFLRPPKGIATTPQPQLFGNVLAVYPAAGGAGAFQAVYLGVGTGTKDVLTLFPAQGENRQDTFTVESALKPLTFKRYVYDDSRSTLAVHFLEGTTPAVVVFRVEKGRLAGEAEEAIRASLGTLGLDNDANRLREQFSSSKYRRRS